MRAHFTRDLTRVHAVGMHSAHLFPIEFSRSAPLHASLHCGAHACIASLADNRALELGESSELMHEQSPDGRACFDGFGEAAK